MMVVVVKSVRDGGGGEDVLRMVVVVVKSVKDGGGGEECVRDYGGGEVC